MSVNVERPVEKATRDTTLDAVRGIAIILLVFFHVVGYSDTGLRLDDEHPVREVNAMLIYIRMPLFTILSGYVYALRPFSGDARRFVVGKSKRLLIPLLVVGTAFAVVQAITPGANRGREGSDWLLLHIEPVAHFWFLEALFWVFLVVMVLEWRGWLTTVRGLVIVLVAAGLLSAVVQPTQWFGFKGAFYLLPFFLFGLGIERFRDQIRRRQAMLVAAPIAVVSLTWCILGVYDVVDTSSRTSIPSLIAGCSAGFVLVRMGIRSERLATIGVFSYTIYLFHTFGTSAMRIGLERVGLDVLAVHLVLGVVAGVAAPMIVDMIARRRAWSRRALLGRSRADLP